jgi:uncharacterized integral membrane protein (TIGR00697 family)
MGNALLLAIEAPLCASFVYLAWRLDKHRLHGLILVFLILIATVGGKVASFEGHMTNVGVLFYASIYLATYFLVERWGRREGLRTIGIGVAGLLFYMLFMQVSSAIERAPSPSPTSPALETIFPTASRIMLASILGFAVSQPVNVVLYSYLKRRMRGRGVWLRATVANAVAQALDSLVFFSIAFSATVPLAMVFDILITGYVIKVAFVALASPLLYLNSVEEDEGTDGTPEITLYYDGRAGAAP